MIHLVLWLNITALIIFIAALPLLAAIWVRGLYKWTRSAIWYLAVLVAYQFLFTFRFFLNRYVPDLSPVLLSILELTSAATSLFSVYLLPLMVMRYTGKTLERKHYLRAALPPLLLLLALIPILYFRHNFSVRIINSVFYLYIAGLSLYGFVKSMGIYFTPEAQAVRCFFLINLLFYLYFFININFFPFMLTPDIPGIILLVPLYVFSWAGILIYASARTVLINRKPSTSLPYPFISRYQISPREQEVILKLIEGQSNKEISEALFISVRTVETHVYNIFTKCDVKSRLELIKRVERY